MKMTQRVNKFPSAFVVFEELNQKCFTASEKRQKETVQVWSKIMTWHRKLRLIGADIISGRRSNVCQTAAGEVMIRERSNRMMRRPAAAVFLVFVMFIFLLRLLGVEFDYGLKNAAAREAGQEILISGRVEEVKSVKEGYFKLVIDRGKTGKIIVGVYGDYPQYYALPGKDIVLTAKTELPQAASNPGCFDYARYLSSKSIFLTGKADAGSLTVGTVNKSFFKGRLINMAAIFRHGFFTALESRIEGDAPGLFAEMLFGYKDRMSDETYESFQKNGTAHILSVSGLHVAIIYGVLNLIAGRRKRSKGAACFIIAVLMGYSLLASFSVPVLRSLLMIVIHILSGFLNRRYDLLSAVLVTATLFMAVNPNIIFDPGFILSFGAIVFLGIIGPGISRRIKKENIFTNIFFPIIAIQLGMMPITAWTFNYFSLAAFIANVPVIFLSSIMIPLGMIMALVFFLMGFMEFLCPLLDLLAAIGEFLGNMMIFFNEFTGGYGRLAYYVESPSIFIIAAFYIIVFLIFSEITFLHPLNRKKWIVCGLIIAVAAAGAMIQESLRPQVVFVDVGQGDCAHIRTPSGKNYLVDGGGSLSTDYDVGEKVVLPYLLKNGVRSLDGVIISHMDADHYMGIAGLSKKIDTGKIILYSGYRNESSEAARLLNKRESELYFVDRGDSFELDAGVSIKIIFPDSRRHSLSLSKAGNDGQEGFNSTSLVMLLNYRGTRILFTGDIGAEEERQLRGEYCCDIVKVPHHGSRYSSSEEFVRKVKARISVIQVGKNNFGHPADSVIESYEKNCIMVFRNDKDGAVLVNIDDRSFSVKGYESGEKYGL